MKDVKLDHPMYCMQSPFVQQEAKVSVLAETFLDNSGQIEQNVLLSLLLLLLITAGVITFIGVRRGQSLWSSLTGTMNFEKNNLLNFHLAQQFQVRLGR